MPLSPEIVQALVKTIETKDLATAAHTWRVVLYTRVLAEHFGMDNDRIARLSTAAALHDLGKIDIPDAILQKPGPLTPDEFEVIKIHPVTGHQRLLAIGEDDPLVLDLVRHHHEQADGKGYPDGLKRDETAVIARYFAVVDSFDALTSVRPYRHEVGPDAAKAAIKELHAGVGTHYCQECVLAFANLYDRGKLDWILENFNDRHDLIPFDCPTKAQAATERLRR